MSERQKNLDAVVKGTSFDSLKCAYCQDAFADSDNLRLVNMKTPLGETRVPYHAECAQEYAVEEEKAAQKAKEKERKMLELKRGLVRHPYDGLDFEPIACDFNFELHRELHGKLTMEQRLEVLKTGELSGHSNKCDYAKGAKYCFDKSLEQVELRGYARHPTSQELFSVIFGGLEGALPEKLVPVFLDMAGPRILNKFGSLSFEGSNHVREFPKEFIGLGLEVRADKLLCYVSPKFICGFDVRLETLWCDLPKQEISCSNFAEFDLPVEVSKKLNDANWRLHCGEGESSVWVNAFELGEDFVDFIYGRTEFSNKKYADVFPNVRNQVISVGGPNGGKLPFFSYYFHEPDFDGLIEFKPKVELPVTSRGVCASYTARDHVNVHATSNYLVSPSKLFDISVHSRDLNFNWAGRGVRQKSFLTKIKERFGK